MKFIELLKSLFKTKLQKQPPRRITRKRSFFFKQPHSLASVSELLEDRTMLSGVTIVTHGYVPGIEGFPGWVTEMSNSISRQIANSYDEPEKYDEIAHFKMTVTEHLVGGPEISDEGWAFSGEFNHSGYADTKEAALEFNLKDSFESEVIISLDWQSLAHLAGPSPFAATQNVAEAVTNFLSNTLGPLGEQLLSLPVHLIGHSRGGSLVGALAEDFGELGLLVDQVTYLDTHPILGDYGYNLIGTNVKPFENVIFADSYWRSDKDPIDFDGAEVNGAFNVELEENVLGGIFLLNDPGYLQEHSDVHLWYQGTIDLESDIISDGTVEFVPVDWYVREMGPRDEIGYYFSRIGGGDRFSAEEGLHPALGGQGDREGIVDDSDDVWSSLVDLQISNSDLSFISGDSINVDFYYRDNDSPTTFSLFLDDDRNPFNNESPHQLGNPVRLSTTNPIITGSENDIVQVNNLSFSLTGIYDGDYFVYGQVKDDEGHIRYAYAPQKINVLEDSSGGTPRISDLISSATSVEQGETFTLTAFTTATHAVDYVRFYRNSGNNPFGIIIGTDSDSSDGWTLSVSTAGLSEGTYQFTAEAVDNLGNPPEIAIGIWITITAQDITPPSPNQSSFGISPTALGTTSIIMSATEATDPSGVEYYFEETSGNPGGSDSGWQDSRLYTDSGLSPDTTYTYRVRTRDKSSNQNTGSFSASQSATTEGASESVPTAPTDLGWNIKSVTLIIIAWNDNSDDESGFRIERRIEGEDTWSVVATIDADSESYQDEGLEVATSYQYRVQAYNDAGTSGYSNMITVATLAMVPASPSDLTAVATSSDKVNLSWQDISPIESGFRIERRAGTQGVWSEIANVAANQVSFTDTEVVADTIYQYRVRTFNAAGNSGYSNVAEVTTLPFPPTLTIAAMSANKNEEDSENTPFTFTVLREGDASNVLNAAWTVTGNGSASANADDFGGTFPNGIVHFDPNETSQTITVLVTGDETVELDEEFKVTLSDPTEGTIISTDTAKGTILNDESATVNFFGLESINEGDNGQTTQLNITVTLSNTVDAPVVIKISTYDGTATVTDNDYTTLDEIRFFIPGDSLSQTKTIQINGDNRFESDETFYVTLSNLESGSRNVSLGTSTVTATILNDDPDPNVGEIRGIKWHDVNDNSLRDSDDPDSPNFEPGLSGWTIYIDANNDAVLNWTDGNFNGVWDQGEGELWTVTGLDGTYVLANVPTGEHIVREVLRSNWRQTFPTTTSHFATDFVTDPGLQSNNTNRYFIADGVLEANSLTNSQEYGTFPVDYSGESFTLDFDIKILDRTNGDTNFGLFSNSRKSNQPSPGDPGIYVIYGGYERGLSLHGYDANGVSFTLPTGGLFGPFELNTVYHNNVTYDAETHTAMLHVSTAADPDFFSGTVVIPEGLPALPHLGVSSVGSWSSSGRQQHVQIDNVEFATPGGMPGTQTVVVTAGATIANIDIGSYELFSITSQYDLRIVNSQTATESNGEIEALPDNLDWIGEWDDYWVELWLSTPATTDLGIQSGTFNLNYNTDITSAAEIEFGPAFSENRSGNINDMVGSIENLSAETTLSDVGDDQYVLFARIRFESLIEDAIDLDLEGQSLNPQSPDVVISNPIILLVGNETSTVTLESSPSVLIWANPFDFNDDDKINYRDLIQLVGIYGIRPSESSSQYARFADFNQSDRVDYRDLIALVTNYNKSKLNQSVVNYPLNFPDAWNDLLIVNTQIEPSAKAKPLTQSAAEEMLGGIKEQFQPVLAPSEHDSINGVSIQVVDLEGGTLGRAANNVIYLDINAAGYGWFVDQTPMDHSEFVWSSDLTLIALPDHEAEFLIDLRTVILHELGHLVGYQHNKEGIMHESLTLGERKISPWDSDFNDESSLEESDQFFITVKDKTNLLLF
tara:strand:- start:6646 stop:12345 length:5700 start_codon:yes stop_codon:yes gene_type:complete